MSRTFVLLRNIASNGAGFAVNAAVTLLLTPFILHQLGEARYGIWILSVSLIGHYGLLDLGFRAGVTQFLTRYLAVRDIDRASGCMSSAVVVLSGLGTLLVVLSIAAAALAPRLFDLPADLEHEIFWCILIVGISGAVSTVFFAYEAVFVATQRFDIANIIGIGTRLLTAAAVFAALKMDYGLIGISAATCLVTLIDYLIRWRVACRLVPNLNVAWSRARFAFVRQIASFGIWNFLSSLNNYVYLYVPSIIIGWFMPVAAVGYYALATGLARQLNAVLQPLSFVFYPAAADLHAKGDRRNLTRLYHDGSRLLMLAMIALVMGAAFWAEDFYRLWIGEQYLSGSPFHSVALLLQILLLSVVTTYTFNIGTYVLVGAGHIKPVAIAVLLGSIINVIFSLLLISTYGLAGPAIATVIASVFIDLLVMPILLHRYLGLSIGAWLRQAFIRPAMVAVVAACVIAGIRLVLGPAETWTALLVQGAIAAAALAAVNFAIGITAAERQRLVFQPALSLWKRVRPLTASAS